MKKAKLLLISLAALSLSFVGCNNTKVSSIESSMEPSVEPSIESSDSVNSSISSVDSTTSEESLSSEEPGINHKYNDSYYEIPEGYEETTYKINISEGLIDANIEKYFITGVDDYISFSFANPYSDTSEVEISNENVIKLEKMTETRYKIITVHEGDAVLTINDKNGITRYQNILHVRDAMTQDEMEEYLSDVEYWKAYAGLGDDYKLTFLFDNQVAISGSLEGQAFEGYTATFKLASETETEFRYKFTDKESQESSAALTGFNVSKAGEIMYLQYRSGTAALMFPNTANV